MMKRKTVDKLAAEHARIKANVLRAEALRAAIAPTLGELTAELERQTNAPAMQRKGTQLFCDNVLALIETSAELCHVDGIDTDDVGLMPMSTQLMAVCIYAAALGISPDMVVSMLRAVWDKAADMKLIPARGH